MRPRNDKFSLGVIGYGNMGSALLRGIVAGRVIPAGRICAWDSQPKKVRALVRSLRIRSAGSNAAAAQAQVILLAVKPQQMAEVLAEIRPHLRHKPLVISIAAGIPLRWLERKLGPGVPVIRVMPNMPALVQRGISAVAAGRWAGAAHRRFAERLLRTVGKVVPVSEKQMDAVTAVSGSGPAYFFRLMEEMERAGVELGLSAAAARRLAVETAAGAGKLAACSGEPPAVLRARVASKGGTTEAAFRLFEKKGLGKIIRAGIHAAAKRSKELSRACS